MRRRAGRIFLAVLFSLFVTSAHAHPSPHSSIELTPQDTEVHAELKLPLEQLALAFGRPLSGDLIDGLQEELKSYIAAHFRVRSAEGESWTLSFVSALKTTENETPIDLVVQLRLVPPPGASAKIFTLESDLIQHQIVSHKIFVVWRKNEVLDVLRYLHNSVLIDLERGHLWPGFAGTFWMGVKHIAEGFDHLLFLFMLLLPAPLVAAGGRWGGSAGTRPSLLRLLGIVTAFTIGHSLTLVVGAVGWLKFPSAPVEALIAFSVLLSAVHAFRPIFPRREFWIAGGFGLIHGLAFSSVVAEFGIQAKELALSVLGFNLGIEFMQLALVCFVVPGLLLLNRTRWYPSFRLSCAAIGVATAGFWLVERLSALR